MERITRAPVPAKDTPVPEHTCDTCKHFARVNGADECHRNPPQGMLFMGPGGGPGGAVGYWPPVVKDPGGRFCGEWSLRPIHQNA